MERERHRAFVAHSRSFSFVHSFVRSFVRNWKRRKKAEIPAHTCTQEHRGGEREERGSFKFFRKMNAPGSRRVKLQKFRTLYSLPMTNEGRTYSFTLQKSPWLINAPPLPPLSPRPLIFTAVLPLLFLFLYSLSTRPHSFRCICTHVRIQPSSIHTYIYMEF